VPDTQILHSQEGGGTEAESCFQGNIQENASPALEWWGGKGEVANYAVFGLFKCAFDGVLIIQRLHTWFELSLLVLDES